MMIACTGSTLHESVCERFTGRLFSRPSISSTALPKQKGHSGLLLKDMNGTVLSVDRHKRQAKIRLELMGVTKVVYMNYILLEKQTAETGEEEPEESEKG